MMSALNAEYHKLTIFRWWYWALVPLLAIVAYASVLRMGFLADDFFQLYEGHKRGKDFWWSFPTPQGPVGFVRPVGVMLIYQLGSP